MANNEAERTYEAMAPIYDDFTAHHDYDIWTRKVLKALDHHGLQGRRLLDVGCGTGKSFLPMLERGWKVTACDISASMLERARGKADDRAQLSVADMRELPAFGSFDLVWAMDDAVNYLLSGEELVAALTGMANNLAADGLLLFDLNTLLTYRTFFSTTETVEQNGRKLIWCGQASADVAAGSICESILEEQGGDVEAHRHRQRHFAEAEVREALEWAGLNCLGVYGLYTDGILKQPLDEAVHTKVVYVASRGDRS